MLQIILGSFSVLPIFNNLIFRLALERNIHLNLYVLVSSFVWSLSAILSSRSSKPLGFLLFQHITQGTLNAACDLVKQLGGDVLECVVILEHTGLDGRERIPVQLFALMEYTDACGKEWCKTLSIVTHIYPNRSRPIYDIRRYLSILLFRHNKHSVENLSLGRPFRLLFYLNKYLLKCTFVMFPSYLFILFLVFFSLSLSFFNTFWFSLLFIYLKH